MILFQFSSFQLFSRFSNMVRTRDPVLKLSFPKASCSEKAPFASFPKSVFSKQRISATSTTLLFCIFGPGHIAWVPSSYHHHIIIYHFLQQTIESLMWKRLGSELVCRGSYIDALQPRLKTWKGEKTTKLGRFGFSIGMPSGETCYHFFWWNMFEEIIPWKSQRFPQERGCFRQHLTSRNSKAFKADTSWDGGSLWKTWLSTCPASFRTNGCFQYPQSTNFFPISVTIPGISFSYPL